MLDYKILFRSLFVVSMLSSSLSYANIVSVEAPEKEVMQGDIFSLKISGSDFTTPLDAGGFDISFKSEIIIVAPIDELPDGVTEQVNLDVLWDLESPRKPVIKQSSIEDIFFFTNGSDAIGDFDIATIWFKATGLGTSSVGLTESQLNPFAGGGGALAVDLNGIDVNVQVVPLPAAIWFLATGLIGLVSSRRFV